ncbi:hypothetical protein AB1J28_09670 [Lysinibacillus irui]|uniref:hypothetical protein n=1 Tax=Lysinibacillus irui TaxID=2998077 RepID=UPI003D2C9398
MKKSLFIVPAVAIGIFTGVSNDASAQELNSNTQAAEAQVQAITTSSIYDNAPELKNGYKLNSQTSNTYPIQRYKFYYDGNDGYAHILFQPEGNQKLNVLNGNLI